jgi:hypothetical protein
MKKIFFIAGVLVIALATAMFFVTQISQKKNSSSNQVGGTESLVFPGVRDGVVSDDGEVSTSSITTTSTPTSSVDMLLTDAAVEDIIKKSESLEYENIYRIADTELYTIDFVSHTQYFTVLLKKIPLEEGQRAAEKFLLTFLGVSGDELCALSIDVFAPETADPDFSQDLGFSKCPGPRVPDQI